MNRMTSAVMISLSSSIYQSSVVVMSSIVVMLEEGKGKGCGGWHQPPDMADVV